LPFFATLGEPRALAGTRTHAERARRSHVSSPWAHPLPAFILCDPHLPGVPAVTPRLLLLAFVLVLAAGCGQKGPLYMPDESQDESTEETDD